MLVVGADEVFRQRTVGREERESNLSRLAVPESCFNGVLELLELLLFEKPQLCAHAEVRDRHHHDALCEVPPCETEVGVALTVDGLEV